MGRKLRMLGVCHYSLEDVALAEKINRCYCKEVSVVFADARPDDLSPVVNRSAVAHSGTRVDLDILDRDGEVRLLLLHCYTIFNNPEGAPWSH
jgi:hypothetical protein